MNTQYIASVKERITKARTRCEDAVRKLLAAAKRVERCRHELKLAQAQLKTRKAKQRERLKPRRTMEEIRPEPR
jgi:hypothetical protein